MAATARGCCKRRYDAYIQFVTNQWPGWTAPKGRSDTSLSTHDIIATDAADPRAVNDNADWLKIKETAEWLETIVPQSRLDAYPVYVLCRELLRKVMQREVEYHDARNIALSDLVAQLRAEVAEREAAMGRAARAAQLREQEAQEKHRREAEAAAADQMRLERALDAALSEAETLRERLALARVGQSDAEAAAMREEHRADRLEKMGKKMGEEAAVRWMIFTRKVAQAFTRLSVA